MKTRRRRISRTFAVILTGLALVIGLLVGGLSQRPTPTPAKTSQEPQGKTTTVDGQPGNREGDPLASQTPLSTGDQGTAPDSAPNPDRKAADQKGNTSAYGWPLISSALTLLLNATLALVTIALWRVGCVQVRLFDRQNRIMKRQSRIMADQHSAAMDSTRVMTDSFRTNKQIERAYVTLSHGPPGLVIDPVIVAGSENPVPHQQVSISITVQNRGNTPATVTMKLVHFFFSDGPIPDSPPYIQSLQTAEGTFLVKDQSFSMTGAFPVELATLDEVKKGTLTLYVIGYVDYIDNFGDRHRAGYGRVYERGLDWVSKYQTPTGKDDLVAFAHRNNLPFITRPGYNYDRPRKKGEGRDWDQPSQQQP